MELDELKTQLNLAITGATEQRSAADITLLLKKDTMSVAHKLKRSLWLELAVSILFVGLCVYMIFFNGYRIYQIFFTTFFFICLAFIFILYALLKKVNTLTGAVPVKQNLQKLVAVMDEYLKRYLQFTLLLLPVCFVFALWLSYNDEEKVLMPLGWDIIIYLTLAMMVLAAGVYFLTRWYLKKLYGNYLHQLKNLVKELENEQAL